MRLRPVAPGSFGFACGMNMIHGTLVVDPGDEAVAAKRARAAGRRWPRGPPRCRGYGWAGGRATCRGHRGPTARTLVSVLIALDEPPAS